MKAKFHVPLNFRITTGLAVQLRTAAAQQGKTVTDVVRAALEEKFLPDEPGKRSEGLSSRA